METKRVITREQVEHLPSDLHKMVAKKLIGIGEWSLKDEQISGYYRMVRL